MKWRRVLLPLFLLALLAVVLVVGRRGEGPRLYPRTVRWDVLGPVPVTIQVVAASDREAHEATEAAFAAMSQVNNLMNGYLAGSEISRLNRSGGALVHVSSQTEYVLRRSIYFGEVTGGAFDVTAGPVIRLWKRVIEDAKEKDGREVKLPDAKELEAARKLVGYRNLDVGENTAQLKLPGMSVDLGGIAKGYAVDKAVEALKAHGITSALVDAGGDGYALGTRPDGTAWRVGIQDPRGEEGARLRPVVLLSNMAYATSGDYVQYVDIGGVRYTHIVDPRTGEPARQAASATVVAGDCTTADALATGVSVLGPADGLAAIRKVPGVEVMVISVKDGKLEVVTSAGFDKFVEDKP